jgi:hypothetical protein
MWWWWWKKHRTKGKARRVSDRLLDSTIILGPEDV